MSSVINDQAIAQLFTEARTHHAWENKPVSDDLLHKVYEMMKFAPTSMNSNPGRILFIKSNEQREKLLPSLMGSNADQVKAAPVTAIIATDEKFYDHLPKLFPFFDAKAMMIASPAMAEATAFRNSSLQGAYFMIAARALGLDVGAMSGFDNAKVDEAFFKGTSWKSNFIVNIGYGDHSKLYPRGERLSFAESCKIV